MDKLTKWLIATAAAALLPALAQGQIPSEYKVSIAHGFVLNDLGQTAELGNGKLLIWDHGVSSTMPGSVRQGTLYGINSQGTVVGSALLPDFSDTYQRPAVWRNGSVVQRLEVKGTGGMAIDVNNRGDIIGRVQGASASGGGGWVDFLVRDGAVQYFDNFSMLDINESGQILGSTPSGFAIWDQGVYTPVHTGSLGRATRFNSTGQILGTDDGGAVAVYEDGAIQRLWSGLGHSINDSGVAVGQTDPENAMVWYQGKAYLLDHLVHDPLWSAYWLADAVAVNAQGDILVQTGDQFGQNGPMLLLSPVPEPALGWMLLAGLALLYRRPVMRRTISSP